MSNWLKIAQNQQPSVSIDMTEYQRTLWEATKESIDRMEMDRERLKTFSFHPEKLFALLQKFNYPKTQEVWNAVNSKDYHQIYKAYNDVFQWYINIDKRGKYDEFLELRKELKQLSDLSEHLETQRSDYKPYDEEAGKEQFQKEVAESYKNMEIIKKQVEEAIGRIANWNGSPVIIQCATYERENFLNPVEDTARIYVGGTEESPMFSWFNLDGKIEIDDVFEAGDYDSFPDNKVQIDYFNLISEIRKPGSTGKPGKILTLYTARPVKDRKFYLENSGVPANIFLTNKYDSAEGLARDLGSGEVRDVWKVRIDERYLMTTLDSPMEKQYQVMGEGIIPVRSMTLLSAGE